MFGWLIDLIMMLINFIMSFFSKKQVQFSEDTKKESVTDAANAESVTTEVVAVESSEGTNVVVNE